MRGTSSEIRKPWWKALRGWLKRVLCRDRRSTTELLLHRQATVAEQARWLLVEYGRCGLVVQLLLQVTLLAESLDVKMKWVVDLLVEEYTGGFATARTWRSWAETRNKTVRDEVPVV